jgi:single-stranded-DNA-specific exonuclease
MEREWRVKPVQSPSTDLLSAVENNLTIAGYLMERGITTSSQAISYLQPDRENLADPFELPDMDKAVQRIEKAISTHETIGIWGDFDADGQTATAIFVECLTKLGTVVHYYLPVRGRESHGIAIPALQRFMGKGIQLLITCDTGVSEHEAVRYANDNGLDVIITDHHTLPEELPLALACVNPRRLLEDHPLGSLSGSGTAFEVMLAVCRRLGKEEIAFESIDLTAVGLIADLAPLKRDSRLLAQLGLERMSAYPRGCLRAMLESAGMTAGSIDEQTIGYILAPRLNAAGRLEDANPLVSFLMDQPPETLKDTAERLESLNANRKWLCDQVYQAALVQLDRQREYADDPIIILSNPTWPGGVLGLVAGHLATDFNRPAILLNDSTDGLLRGSARSVEGINITEAIASTATLLQSYGGHPMAAGLSLLAENMPEFRRKINAWLLNQGMAVPTKPLLEIDAELSIPQINTDFFSSVKKLAPFGNENPPLVFCSRRVQIAAIKPLGRNKEHFKFVLQDAQGNSIPLVWWNADETQIPADPFDLVYALNENEYKGEVTLQAEWIDHHLVEEPESEIRNAPKLMVTDFRSSPDPLKAAKDACVDQAYLIFQEPPVLDNPLSAGRNHMHAIDCLILASMPPSRQVFEQIISASHPKQLILAFESPSKPSFQVFLKHLGGLIKYAAEKRNGLASTDDLAEAMNTTVQSIEVGIHWFEVSGKIEILAKDNSLMEFSFQNHAPDKKPINETENSLRYLLSEEYSFLKIFYSLPIDTLISQIESIPKGKTKRSTDNTALTKQGR